MSNTCSRHWSFFVTEKKIIYPLVLFISVAGTGLAVIYSDPTFFSRMGNLIIVIGLWISMRFTLREGINKYKNCLDDSPTLPGNGPLRQINAEYFNKIGFLIGDANLQLHGLYITIYGAMVGSWGDLLLKTIFSSCFKLK